MRGHESRTTGGSWGRFPIPSYRLLEIRLQAVTCSMQLGIVFAVAEADEMHRRVLREVEPRDL